MSVSHIYIHVPFCRHICPYCAFARGANLSAMELWLDALLLEIEGELASANQPFDSIETLYIGGGTPSLLDEGQLSRIMKVLKAYLKQEAEFTMELNPEDCTQDYLDMIRKQGVNRLSVGVQSFHSERLKSLGRCDLKTVEKALDAIRHGNWKNYSVDLMYAYPDQEEAELDQDLKALLDLNPPHVSVYALQIEENSVFGKLHLQPIDEDLEADYYEKIGRKLEAAGYEHYEISSFAKKGKQSRHNSSYWSDEYYMAFGYGACGYDANGYYEHADSLKKYLNSPEKFYTGKPDPFLAIMMALRTKRGLDYQKWQKRYGLPFFETYTKPLETYSHFFHQDGQFIWLDEKGREQLNTVLIDFMED